MNKKPTVIEQMIQQNGGSSVFRDPMPGSYRLIDLNALIPRFVRDVQDAQDVDKGSA